MGAETTHPCSKCQRLQAQLDALQAQFESQQAQLKTLQVTINQLQAQLAAARKNSSTSSKPPSSDIVKPPKPPPPEGQDQRRIGGQPGHPKHERDLFPPDQVNGGSHDYFLDLCPSCGHGLHPTTDAPRVVQQIEIQEVPLSIEAHRSHPAWCPHCQKRRYATLPLTIERGGLVGPRLTTLIA
jgi:transposase